MNLLLHAYSRAATRLPIIRCHGAPSSRLAGAFSSELASVGAPVLLWHGEQDRNVPAIHGRYLAGAIPDWRATFHADAGHLSLFVNRQREILSALKLAAAAAQHTVQSDE